MEQNFINQLATKNGSYPFSIINTLSKGVARVNMNSFTNMNINNQVKNNINNDIKDGLNNNKKKKNNTFTITLMKLVNNGTNFYYIITCCHCISEDDVKSKNKLNIFYGELDKEKNIKIKLDEEERFIKRYINTEKKLDIIVIQIFIDEITEDANFLMPDLNYKNGYNNYKKNSVFIGGYPYNQENKKLEEMCYSNGIINRLCKDNYFFYHDCDTFSGSSGSPLINVDKKIIGIHSGCFYKNNKNVGIFIGPIIDDLLENKKYMKLNNININIINNNDNINNIKFINTNNMNINNDLFNYDIILNNSANNINNNIIINNYNHNKISDDVNINNANINNDNINNNNIINNHHHINNSFYHFIDNQNINNNDIINYEVNPDNIIDYPLIERQINNIDDRGIFVSKKLMIFLSLFAGIFVLVLFCLFFAFDLGCVREKVKLYYENGNIKYFGFTIGDLYDGPGQLFSEKDNGTLLYDGNFTKGKKNGVGRENYENGTRKYYGNYTNDTYNGIGE